MNDLSYISFPNSTPLLYESIADVLFRKTKEIPDREICTQRLLEGGRRSLTYIELVNRSTELAKYLISRGIIPGDSVAITGPNSIELIIGEFAILMTGAVVVQINKTTESFAETAKLLRASKSKAVLLDPESDEKFISDLETYCNGVESLNEKFSVLLLKKTESSSLPSLEDIILTAAEAEISLPRIQPESSAVIFTTSGSTGVPKMVEMTHFALINASYTAYVVRGGDGEHGVYYNDRPFSWLGACPIFSVINGNVRVFTDTGTGTRKENIMDVWDIIMAEKCTNAVLFPSALLELLENLDAITKHCYKLTTITTGGQLIGSHLTEIIGKCTDKLCMLYGSTEVREMCFIELTPEMEIGYVGPLLPGYEVKIVGENGETLNSGILGEILVRSPWMLKSYRNAPDLNAVCFADGGWFRTGDIGNITQDGKLFVKGKSSDVIKRGSVKVLPSVVETTINKLQGVRDVVVLSVPDIRLLEDVCACFMLERHAKTTKSEINQKCRETLGDNVLGSAPSYFLQFDSFPKLNNGKTDKVLLKKKAMERLHLLPRHNKE